MKNAGRFRLTGTAKVLLLVVLIAAIGGGIFYGLKSGWVTTESSKKKENLVSDEESVSNEGTTDSSAQKKGGSTKKTSTKTNTDEITISIDEWVGYATLIQANGGLETKAGSIFDNLGLKVHINIINDPTQSSNALIKGELDGAGYTVNRLAFLSDKFTNANVPVVMPFITNYSNGGDGIISTSSINTIEDLVGKRVGVPQFSESQTMVVWFVNQSNLSQSDKDSIINNLILFETSDETAKAFFAGQIDAAGTWQPYLTQAENMTDSHILFSTASSTRLVLSGIVFRKDFAESNSDAVSKFIDGTLQAIDLYDKDLEVLKKSMPMFSGMSDDDIVATTMDADLATWKNNMDLLNGDAKTLYTNMCDVWKSLGETANADLVDSIFDASYMATLSDKYETIVQKEEPEIEKKTVVTEENREELTNAQALLTKSGSVNFIVSTAKFSDPAEASKVLDDFINVAKMLDGAIIRIEGNTDPNPISDPNDEANLLLSKQRAETVKQYLIANGISADRIITIGNGSSKPIVDNDTEEHKAMNRRTDVGFIMVEQ